MFNVRPLFHPEPAQSSEKLSRALNKLQANLRDLLFDLSKDRRHDALATWAFNPPIQTKTIEVRLELKSGSPLKRFFVARYEAFDRQIAFVPTIPNFAFEIRDNHGFESRVTDVLTEFVRQKEREEDFFVLDSITLHGKARLSFLDVEFTPAANAKKKEKPSRAMLFGGEEKKSGEEELRKTGQPLHQWYPDDLQRALGRDTEVEEIARLLASKDRRPILLVGPPKVGKTAVIHELAWNISNRKKEKFAGAHEIWLLSPMRLISGMSYLGEWENRVNAIIDYAREKDRVLYFDDLIGLFSAGVSAASDLNVAQVLKPHLEKRALRVIAEITPEALRVLRETDRNFAEMFHIVPIDEPPEADVWRMLIHLVREMERDQQCAFDLEVLPLVHDLHRRFMREAAFPGKAAGFLRRLAVRHKKGTITRAHVLEEFTRQTGLQTEFVVQAAQPSAKSARDELTETLSADLKGQEAAVAAFVDVLLTFKIGLNDPARPVGTMLLLGPTGVGKTESAKALARTMFGNPDRLLRFDLNEFVDARAVARLTGTLQQPDGLLTGAVRRQPFSIVLFDEIEKAAPEVFDLLLTVLDEGRLTDSLGRVADFTNCVILLSSNLGAREARSKLGFAKGSATEEKAHYVSAAEKFFRPEFFNRLDRIIPFRALSESELDEIAQRLLLEVQKRDGLKRRDCTLSLTEAARARLVALGHHPQLGARALKRTVEREVVQRLAEQIAAKPPSLPVVARLDVRDEEFFLDVQALAPVETTITWAREILENETKSMASHLDGVETFLDRIEAELDARAPSGATEWNNISPERAHYFFCREQFAMVERLLNGLARPRATGPRMTMRLPKAQPRKFLIRQTISGDPKGKRLRERADLRNALSDLSADEATESADSPLLNLYREAAFLNAMISATPAPKAAALAFACKFHLLIESQFIQRWTEFFASLWSGESKTVRQIYNSGIAVSGMFIDLFMPNDGATILEYGPNGSRPISCRVLPTKSLAAAGAILEGAEIAMSSGPIIARYRPSGSFFDYRTGLAMADFAQISASDFRALMLSTLALPPELQSS